MAVIKGEGKVTILFGERSVTSGAITHQTYLARPDLAGEWPTLVVVPGAWGVTSSVKDLARRIARRGVAAIAVDLYRQSQPSRRAEAAEAEVAFDAIPVAHARRVLSDIVSFIVNPAGFWSNAEHGFGILGLGSGGGIATETAVDSGAALVLAASLPVAALARVTAPILGLLGKDDEVVSLEDVAAARADAPHAEWVLYEGVGHDFLDDYLEGFDDQAHQDAVERIVEFCEKHLPPAT